ncbi:MAG: hypothetical protein C6W56_13885 [Caldibacillus debilis]|uniref:Uncharacterized protein n=1 Tax=Caldibacillus debilis TaxID=301148 RepID=A0A150M3L3_9BACI|nr:hypothetical protein B4135_0059 [Caldibacillus debilis]MBO2481464.1 hypothetical protein [Bacillaceae bacterium]OUM83549.1 MAG: hypothetical protein BAA03_03140 [Caldibacillus debilis]REJ25162.1 MAG: hypothetical protein C6W56_13885 [Caldibacillus debilis]
MKPGILSTEWESSPRFHSAPAIPVFPFLARFLRFFRFSGSVGRGIRLHAVHLFSILSLPK